MGHGGFSWVQLSRSPGWAGWGSGGHELHLSFGFMLGVTGLTRFVHALTESLINGERTKRRRK